MEANRAHPGPGGMYAPVLPCVLSQHPSAKLRRLDLSGNSISSIHNDALRLLPALQDLILSENQLAALPVLPSGIELLDVRLNRLQSSGIQPEAFMVSQSTMQSAPCPCTLTSQLFVFNSCLEPKINSPFSFFFHVWLIKHSLERVFYIVPSW